MMKELFQKLIEALNEFWEKQGCVLLQPYDLEVGAGTFHVATFFKSLDKNEWQCAYVQPSRRPADGRYGDNPLRVQFYYQYQVLLKPAPADIQERYLKSLEFLGFNLKEYDLRFVEDDWESPTLGAWGVGWEVWLDSLEITQFTYFQQIGGIDLPEIAVELTYGLERLAMYLQDVEHMFDLKWSKDVSYEVFHRSREKEFSKYNFEIADISMYRNLFANYEREADRLLEEALLFPAYECVLKLSHIFNILDARGALSVMERQNIIARIRKRANACAKLYLKNYVS